MKLIKYLIRYCIRRNFHNADMVRFILFVNGWERICKVWIRLNKELLKQNVLG